MLKKPKNFAFIDAQNVTMGIKRLGWNLDWYKLMLYLKDKYYIDKVFVFIGYIEKNKMFYDFLRRCGYILIFKPVIIDPNSTIKGNCDGDMILYAVSKIHNYDKAILMTSDGDFYSTVKFLYRRKKLKIVFTPGIRRCSQLLKREAKEKIFDMAQLKNEISRP